MDLELKGRTCLVSGSSSGIGRAVASLLAEEGARVLFTARSKSALARVAEEIRAAGGIEPALFEADFGEEKAPERLIDKVLHEVGTVDVLVNNAGGSRPMTTPDDALAWEEAFRLNFTSARRLGKLLLPPWPNGVGGGSST